jgi:hypothetical protein
MALLAKGPGGMVVKSMVAKGSKSLQNIFALVDWDRASMSNDSCLHAVCCS